MWQSQQYDLWNVQEYNFPGVTLPSLQNDFIIKKEKKPF